MAGRPKVENERIHARVVIASYRILREHAIENGFSKRIATGELIVLWGDYLGAIAQLIQAGKINFEKDLDINN